MKISIVIPAHNSEHYIAQAINSCTIRNKDLDVEVVVVDDGSTDDTSKICKDLSKTNTNIKYIYQKNVGALVARKTGALAATGDYVMFCDSDDTIYTQHLYDFAKRAYNGNWDILVGCSHDFSNDGLIDFIQKNKICGMIDHTAFIEGILRNTIIFGPSCKLFHKRLINENAFILSNGIVFNEDLFMNIEIAKEASKILILKDFVIYNHLTDNPSSITHTLKQTDAQWIELFAQIKRQIKSVPNLDYAAFVSYVCSTIRANSFNRGRRFGFCNKALQIIGEDNGLRLSTRDKVTILLLNHPYFTKLYYAIFNYRKYLCQNRKQR